MDKWLRGGEQTKITSRVVKIARKVKEKDDLETVKKIINWIKNNLKHGEKNKEEVFRKRTSHEIIVGGFVTGCTDETLVFLSIASACKIPSKYMEGINKNVNQAEDLKEVEYTGHMIAECKLNGEWHFVDVVKNEISKKDEPSFFNDKFKIIAKGLDSWNLNIGSYQKLIRFIDEKSSKL